MSDKIAEAQKFLLKGDNAKDETVEGNNKKERILSLKRILQKQKAIKAPKGAFSFSTRYAELRLTTERSYQSPGPPGSELQIPARQSQE